MPTLKDPLLSVVMPAYNERDTIDEIVTRVLAVPLRIELIVVDDGSKDGTAEILDALQHELTFTLLRQSRNAAVHKAAAVGQPVTQQIAWTVKGGRAECSINGTVVAGYNKDELVGSGKLQSTDGVIGIRFTHNVEAIITDFKLNGRPVK